MPARDPMRALSNISLPSRFAFVWFRVGVASRVGGQFVDWLMDFPNTRPRSSTRTISGLCPNPLRDSRHPPACLFREFETPCPFATSLSPRVVFCYVGGSARAVAVLRYLHSRSGCCSDIFLYRRRLLADHCWRLDSSLGVTVVGARGGGRTVGCDWYLVNVLQVTTGSRGHPTPPLTDDYVGELMSMYKA